MATRSTASTMPPKSLGMRTLAGSPLGSSVSHSIYGRCVCALGAVSSLRWNFDAERVYVCVCVSDMHTGMYGFVPIGVLSCHCLT